MKKWQIAAIGLLLGLASLGAAENGQENDRSKEGIKKNNMFLHIGYQSNQWDSTVHGMDIKATGLKSQKIYLETNSFLNKVVNLEYEKTLGMSDSEQDGLISGTNESKAGMESFAYGISAVYFQDSIDRHLEKGFFHWLASVAASFEYYHRDTTFFGDATVDDASAYWQEGSAYMDTYSAGEKISFKTTFKYDEFSVDILGNYFAKKYDPKSLSHFMRQYSNPVDGFSAFLADRLISNAPQLRLGVFRSEYTRPGAFFGDYLHSSGYYLIFEEMWEINGFFMSFRRANRSLPGFNWDLTFKNGVVSLRNSDISVTEIGKEMRYSGTELDFWYNVEVTDFLHFNIGYQEENMLILGKDIRFSNAEEEEMENDKVSRIYVNMFLHF